MDRKPIGFPLSCGYTFRIGLDDSTRWMMKNLEIKSGELNQGDAWQAVVERDRRMDGRMVYAVKTTGIYCRPSCPSRKPKRENTLFFPLPEFAERAGYRPCIRCQPDLVENPDPQVKMARQVCRFIESHLEEPLTLAALGAQFAVSPHHLQRTFKRTVGITPQQYTEACRMSRVRNGLGRGEEITEALYEAGFSSASRLYSKASAQLGMTPGEYQRGGSNLRIAYTLVESLLGILLVAATEKGICAVRLGGNQAELEEGFYTEFHRANILRDDDALAQWAQEILSHLEGNLPNLNLPLDVQATAFQRQVWQTLQEIPYGSTRSYGEVAAAMGRPGAARAVARACAANPAALLIPCHRVIRSDGGLGGYRWGIERKRKLLDREKAQAFPRD